MTLFVGLSILASLFYGTSDFFGGLAARRLNLLHATAFTHLLATFAALVGLLLVGGEWSLDDAALGAAAGVLALVGFVAFYAAMAIGPMSLLSPAIALVGGVVPVGVAAATGSPLPPLAWFAIALAIVATVLISVPSTRARERVSVRGAVLALVAGLGLGGSVIVLDATSEASGLTPAVVELAVGLVILLLILGVIRLTHVRFGFLAVFEPPPASARQGLSPRRAYAMSGLAGVLLGIANSLFVVALHTGDLAIVAVLVSLYPLATVILAAAVLRERISAVQVGGIVLAIVACGMLAAA
ncbi:DMT family transporter [Glaciihabitans arcticus]|uniref:DMT family transporter n=1 Tax=Glaciihabitans arcticus TaxID=2668039 RepID=A0A4Q9GNH1_9MICO|nr:DMT family transporter [Glaciihabitans arcticus]TBN56241.1 DMT family transporter [Glaciihabitans arcticus]